MSRDPLWGQQQCSRFLIVLSPRGRLRHAVVISMSTTLCGRPCEDWFVVVDNEGPSCDICLRSTLAGSMAKGCAGTDKREG